MFQVRVSCPGGFSEAPLPPSWGGPAGVTPGEGDAAGLPLRSRRVHLHRPTPFVGQKSRRGGRRRGPGRGAGPEALAPRRKESPSGVGGRGRGGGVAKDAGGPRNGGQLPVARRVLGSPKPGVPEGDQGASGPGPREAEGPPARAARTGPDGPGPVRLVRAPRTAGHSERRRRARPFRETEASPRAPSAALSSRPRERPGAPHARASPDLGGGSRGSPRPPPRPPARRPCRAPTHHRDMAARAGAAAERGARVAALGAAARGRRAGTGTRRAGAKARPRPRRDFPLPRGRRRGREGPRPPRCINPFGAPGPPAPRPHRQRSAPRPAPVAHFAEAEPEARPGVAQSGLRSPRGSLSSPNTRFPPAELPWGRRSLWTRVNRDTTHRPPSMRPQVPAISLWPPFGTFRW